MKHPVAHEAMLDLNFRMALYENAKHNLALSGGASPLLLCSKVPYSIFKWVVPGISSCSPEHHRNFNGLNFGEKVWFMTDSQFLLWADDSIDFVMGHLKAMFDNV